MFSSLPPRLDTTIASLLSLIGVGYLLLSLFTAMIFKRTVDGWDERVGMPEQLSNPEFDSYAEEYASPTDFGTGVNGNGGRSVQIAAKFMFQESRGLAHAD